MRIDRFRYDDGEEVEREIVAHPGAVAVVAADGDADLRCASRARRSASRACSSCRRASSTQGEEPLETAKRELAEEIGKGAHGGSTVKSFCTSPGFTDEECHLFLADDLYDEEAEADEDERIEIVADAARPARRDDRASAATRRRSSACSGCAARLPLTHAVAAAGDAGAPGRTRCRGHDRGDSRGRSALSTWCSTSSPTSSSSAGSRATRSRPTAPTCSSSGASWRARTCPRSTRASADVADFLTELATGQTAAARVAGHDPPQDRLPALVLPPPAPRGLRDSDPTAALSAPRRSRKLPQVLTRGEVDQLLAQPRGSEPTALRDRALLELMYACGLRASEAIGLDVGDVDLEDGVLRARGKGSKERVVPIGQVAARAVALLPRARPAGAREGPPRGEAVRQLPRRAAHPPGPLQDRAPARA